MMLMDKKILKGFEKEFKVNDEFYIDHDETLKQHKAIAKQLDSTEQKLLQIDKKYDRKKHMVKA